MNKETENDKPKCETCGGSGEVDDTIHSVRAGIDINKPCPDCQGDAAEFVKELNETIDGVVIAYATDCIEIVAEHTQKLINKSRKAADFIKQLQKAILEFGNNPAGFDWAVLDKLDEQERQIEQLQETVPSKIEKEQQRLRGKLYIQYREECSRLLYGDLEHTSYSQMQDGIYAMKKQIEQLQARLKEAEDGD